MIGLIVQVQLPTGEAVSTLMTEGIAILRSGPKEPTIEEIVDILMAISNGHKRPAVVKFKGIGLIANPGDDPARIVAYFEEANARK